jgi:hypothetical protein
MRYDRFEHTRFADEAVDCAWRNFPCHTATCCQSGDSSLQIYQAVTHLYTLYRLYHKMGNTTYSCVPPKASQTYLPTQPTVLA